MTGREIRALADDAGRPHRDGCRRTARPIWWSRRPCKETIYPQHGPAWYHGPSPDRPAICLPPAAPRRPARARWSTSIRRSQRPRARGQKTYSLHDTHWTGYGAYAGYVGADEPPARHGPDRGAAAAVGLPAQQPRRAGKPRDLALMLGVASFVDLDYPDFADPRREAKPHVTYLTRQARLDRRRRSIDTGQVGKPVLLMTARTPSPTSCCRSSIRTSAGSSWPTTRTASGGRT